MTGFLFIFVYEKKRNLTIYELFVKKRFEIIRIIDYIYITLIITWTKYRFKHPWRMEFSQVSNKESVENRSKACAKPKVLNFIFNNSNIFAFQIFDLNRIIYNCNGYSFHKEASAKMLTNDGENLIVQVTSISYFDNLLFKT